MFLDLVSKYDILQSSYHYLDGYPIPRLLYLSEIKGRRVGSWASVEVATSVFVTWERGLKLSESH